MARKKQKKAEKYAITTFFVVLNYARIAISILGADKILREFTAAWCGKKRFDFLIKLDKQVIVELDGRQHSEPVRYWDATRSIQNEMCHY